MKKAIAFILAFSLMCSLTSTAFADGSGYDFSDWTDEQLSDLLEDLKAEIAHRGQNTGAIIVKDDGSGTSSKDGGLEKRVISTMRGIGYKGSTGPFDYEVQAIQVSEIIGTTQEAASALGLEKGQKAALIGIQMSVENTSNDDMSWHPYMSTIVTSDKEQVGSDWLMSDSVGGTFMGNIVKQGQIFFVCKNTNADNLTSIQWRIDGPSNSHYDRVGDDVKIDFSFQ